MSATLKISEALALPIDAVTQTLACIGRKGAGKTYLASMIAEQMLDAHAQIIVLDPVGNWWGLRVGADGRSKGKDIFVIGGEHGDVPISPEAGARIARLLTEKYASAVLDVSGFRQGDRKRFAADFAEEFFHRKKTQRSAVHLFVEEAQLFIPQRSGPDEARMLGAFESIVRLGRNYGIGATLITQRPQSVNKEVLSQVECLCVLQVNGSHERKALEEWVSEAGADRKLVGELPGLPRGEGYVWSPQWLRIFKRMRFAKKTTFDASATPEVGRAAKAAMLSTVDVESLRADLQEVVAQAEKDDPKVLRRQIAELQKALAAKKDQDFDNSAVVLELKDAFFHAERNLAFYMARAEHLEAFRRGIVQQCDLYNADTPTVELEAPTLRMPITRATPPQAPRAARATSAVGEGVTMPKACRAVLTALVHHGQCSKSRVAALTGYAINGGGFNNALSECRTKGWIKGSDPLAITPEGDKAVGRVDPLPAGEELLAMWKGKLGKAEREILGALAESDGLDKVKLASVTGYAASGGGFNNALSRLRTLELIEGKGVLSLTRDFAAAVRA